MSNFKTCANNQYISTDLSRPVNIHEPLVHDSNPQHPGMWIDELRNEINKGWDGPTSKRTVQDIVKAKAIK